MHTAAPASLIGNPLLGGIFPGSHADIAVLSDDLLRIDPLEIGEVQVIATIRSGEVITTMN